MLQYQYNYWLVKLWRRRWYLLIPLEALYSYLYIYFSHVKDKEFYSFEICWSIACGMADCRMEWLLDWEDLKDKWGS